MTADSLPVVSALVQEINRGNDLNEILAILFDQIQGILPCDRIGVAVLEQEDASLRLVAARSRGRIHLAPGYREKLAGTSLEQVIRRGTPRILEDLEAHLQHRPDSRSTRLILAEGMRSSLTVPLLLRGRPFGSVFFSSCRPRSYREEHLPIVRVLSGFLACAVEKANLIEELRRRGEMLELIFEHSPLAMGMVDRRGIVRSWNAAAERTFGYRADEIVGRPYSVLGVTSPDESGDAREIEMTAKDGDRRIIEVTSNPVRSKEGEIVGRAMTWRDLTAVKQLQTELLSAKVLASVGELAAAVAHEVRNPLAGISGAVQILQEEYSTDDPRANVLREILKQIHRLDRLVRDLLVFARPWIARKERHDLASLARGVVETARPDPRARGILLKVDVTSACSADVDKELVETALSNVIQNAFEAAPPGGTVSVSCGPKNGGRARIVIEDDGPGIPESVRDKIFQPFFTTKSKGTGLGLSIVKRVMESHGGSVRAEPRPGGGTRVILEFPAREDREPSR